MFVVPVKKNWIMYTHERLRRDKSRRKKYSEEMEEKEQELKNESSGLDWTRPASKNTPTPEALVW